MAAARTPSSSGSSDFKFLGKVYKADEWLPEMNAFAAMLADNALLTPQHQLGAGVDMDEAQQKSLRMQLSAMAPFPNFFQVDMWSTFAARYLPALHSALKNLSFSAQRTWASYLICILTLMGGPKDNVYLRKYLISESGTGFAQLVASLVSSSNPAIQSFHPSGPGHIASFIIDLLFWCPPEQGDDERASIDLPTRTLLRTWTGSIQQISENELDDFQQIELQRLVGVLESIDNMPSPPDQPAFFVNSTKQYLADQTETICAGRDMCDEYPQHRCAKCKTIRYCSQDCQTWAWKNGHKLRCHKTEY
ncbi:hypothetical protein DL96DRAFT_304462 [Flagelloscypha sp. PMI_526]|nr:hypothetical protein DL96DRAFT_304462 [Flagelloscypha sp. PMI_526]